MVKTTYLLFQFLFCFFCLNFFSGFLVPISILFYRMSFKRYNMSFKRDTYVSISVLVSFSVLRNNRKINVSPGIPYITD